LRKSCLLKHIVKGKIIGTRRQGRRHKQLLDDLKEARRYWTLKQEVQDRTLSRTQFGRVYGSVGRQTTTWLEYLHNHCCENLKSYRAFVELRQLNSGLWPSEIVFSYST
jgi:hypothetical protein